MGPYRETDRIEARFRKVENDIADLKKKAAVTCLVRMLSQSARDPAREILSRITRNSILAITLCIACGVLFLIGYEQPIVNGLGYSMIPLAIIAVFVAVDAVREWLSRKKDE